MYIQANEFELQFVTLKTYKEKSKRSVCAGELVVSVRCCFFFVLRNILKSRWLLTTENQLFNCDKLHNIKPLARPHI